MLPEEACWIGDVLASTTLAEGATVVDLGSSTEEFRRLVQPYIDYRVFLPLRRRGVRVLHVDARDGDGIDIQLDIAAAQTIPRELLGRASVTLCCNMLEHVVDRARVIDNLRQIVMPGGICIVTVPLAYRYHADPIDTGYRPTPDSLASALANAGLQPEHRARIPVTCDYTDEPHSTLARVAWRGKQAIARRLLRRSVPMRAEGLVSAVVARRPTRG